MLVNTCPYEVWENTRGLRHLLIAPKRHAEHRGNLSDAELADHTRLVARFEEHGWAVYTRGHKSLSKSVAHQHTHVIRQVDRVIDTVTVTARPAPQQASRSC